MSFPGDEPWTVPSIQWHLDLPARGSVDRFEAIRFIGFVNDVVAHGGGTLVVEGSHALVEMLVRAAGGDAGQSADARKQLAARSPWFAALNDSGDPAERMKRLIDEGTEVDGVAVRVVELTGQPGDLVVMHPWMMHNIAPNCGARPRMMFTHTVYAANSIFLGRPGRQSG